MAQHFLSITAITQSNIHRARDTATTLAVQDVAAQPDPRAAAKKAKVEALWAQLNGSRGGAASASATAGRTGTPGATEPCAEAEAGVTAPPATRTAGVGFSLAALCRPPAKRSALEDKDRVRCPVTCRPPCTTNV